jgi:vacuolar-type H+-ATPase subunit I/STV1
MADNPYKLSDAEKKWIRANGEGLKWSINEITKSITGDESKDGRSFEGKAVKQFLLEDVGVEPQVRTVNSKEYQAFQLEKHHIDFVLSNAGDMTTFEMVMALFPELEKKNKKSVMFSAEIRAIQRYVEENLGDQYFTGKTSSSSNFKPPRDPQSAVPLVSRYTGTDLTFSKLKDHQKKSIEKLCKNLKRASLQKTMEQFRSNSERELFLESFVSDTWDKSDLTSGEVSQYVDLAGERVNLYQIKEYQQNLQEQLDDDLANEDGKLRYTLIDAIDKQIQNRDKCMNRIQKLQNDLEGTRTKRLKEQGSDQVNILKLCEELAKEKKRKRIAKMLEKEQTKVAKAIDEIEEMSDYTARLFGASREELLN